MKRLPLVHITDLYHPPQDPDDQIDLATVLALEELDLKAVILDTTHRFLIPKPEGFDIARDPGFIPVKQIGYLLGQSIPNAAGPTEPLRDVKDDASDRPAREQAGIHLLLKTLEASESPVIISCVGSARVLAAAVNREPELVRARTKSVLLNAGSTGGPKREWNVGLDLAAYVALWRSDLPIHWYPCGTETGAFNPKHERGTYWKVAHKDLFDGLPRALRGWFAYGFSGSARGDIIRSLADMGTGPDWETILSDSRNMWSTASFVMATGRKLAQTPDGWRFVRPEAMDPTTEVWSWRLDPISATVTDKANVNWELGPRASNQRIFGRAPGAGYGTAMAEALNVLLRSMPV